MVHRKRFSPHGTADDDTVFCIHSSAIYGIAFRQTVDHAKVGGHLIGWIDFKYLVACRNNKEMAFIISNHIPAKTGTGIMNGHSFIGGIIYNGPEVFAEKFFAGTETDQLSGIIGQSIAKSICGNYHPCDDIALIGIFNRLTGKAFIHDKINLHGLQVNIAELIEKHRGIIKAVCFFIKSHRRHTGTKCSIDRVAETGIGEWGLNGFFVGGIINGQGIVASIEKYGTVFAGLQVQFTQETPVAATRLCICDGPGKAVGLLGFNG